MRKQAIAVLVVCVCAVVAAATAFWAWFADAPSASVGDGSATLEVRDVASDSIQGSEPVSQSSKQGEEEWPGQSQGFVGPNGEGMLSGSDDETAEETAARMDEALQAENEIPRTAADGYVEGMLLVSFYREYGELRAHEIIWEHDGVWGNDDFKVGDSQTARAAVYFPDCLDKASLEALAAELEQNPEVASASLNGTLQLADGQTSKADASSEGLGMMSGLSGDGVMRA